ncbi:MAG TPA: hypothetical protein DEG43_02145 [Acidimicrobiaceae bacterium]|jgi:hypothetical protein|nr:hypothetical protein [Acidimicrobiaceae bacterium]
MYVVYTYSEIPGLSLSSLSPLWNQADAKGARVPSIWRGETACLSEKLSGELVRVWKKPSNSVELGECNLGLSGEE